MNLKQTSAKKILMVSDDFFPAATGVGIHLQIICKELVAQGHDVTILTSKQGNQPTHEVWNGVDVQRCFSLKIAGFYQAIPNLFKIYKLMKKKNFDIVHFHYLSLLMMVVKQFANKLHLKTIYTYHMTEDHLTQPFFMRPFRKLIRMGIVRFSNSVDTVISPSAKLKDEVVQKGVKKPVHFITNPLAREFFYKKPTDTFREKAFQVLFVGRLNPEKNISLLIRAFALHTKIFTDSCLWIIGKGHEEAHLRNLADELGISQQVKFLGFMNHAQLAKYYNSCDVFVLPSLIETQGLVAMEAMSFSKPIIVSKEIVSAQELVDHDNNGYLVDAYEPSDLSERLTQLRIEKKTATVLGLAGRAKIEAYDPEQVTKRLIEIYQELQPDKIKDVSNKPSLHTQESLL